MTSCSLSIIIPCYNAQNYIKNTVTMLETPDIQDCEIIIVNDGSQDNTLNIARELETAYDNIFVINQENKGVSSARNKGLKFAKGKYVLFFDVDDKVEENTLLFYKETFQQRPECEIYAFGYQMSRNGEVIRKYTNSKCKEAVLEGKAALEEIFYGKLYFHICACVFKRIFLEKHGLTFPEGVVVGEDSDFIRRCLVKSNKVYYNSRISFTYQLWSESQTMGNKYTLKTFYSFAFTLKSIDSVKNYVSLYAYNFYTAARYASQILGYLKSDLKNAEIELELKKYRYLIDRKIHIGNLKWTSAIILIRWVPLDFFFKIFK